MDGAEDAMSTKMARIWLHPVMAAMLALTSALISQGANAQVITVEYVHTDALGSPVAVTNQSGGVVERTLYEPYGRIVSGAMQDGPGYTGHVLDAMTGMNYMQQRYYDPMIGRFISVDPVAPDGNSGGNLNRYKYAANNPYTFIDPDGRQECRPCDKWSDTVAQVHKEGRQKELEPLETPALVVTAVMTAPVVAVVGWEGAMWMLANPGAVATLGELGGGAAGVTGTAGALGADARYAQRTFSSLFSSEGKFAGQSVDEVAAALRSGATSTAEVPINYIVRDGQTIILNTRSAQALEAAGIPRAQWNGVNQTGNSLYERLLDGQLGRNPGGPFETVRPSGKP